MRRGTVIRAIRIQTASRAFVRDGQLVERNIAGVRQCAVRMQRNGKSTDSDKDGKMFHNEFFFVKETLEYRSRKRFGFVFHVNLFTLNMRTSVRIRSSTRCKRC